MSKLIRPVFNGYYRFTLMVVVIFSLAASGAWYWEKYRAQQYRNQNASMPMALLSYMLEEKPAQEQAHWVAIWGQRLGVDLSLVNASSLHFGYFQQRRLDSLQTVIEANKDRWRFFHLLPDTHQVLVLDALTFNERQPVTLMQLLREWIEQVPPTARDARFERLRSSSEWPMRMGQDISDNLCADQREQLAAHQIVVNLAANGPNLSLYAILNDGRWIVVGPISFFAPTPIIPLYVLLSLIALAIILLSYGFSVRRERRLTRLWRAAERIAAGDFSYRATVDAHDPFKALAFHINGMAEQVQASLGAQQDLIQAVSHEFRTPVARIRFALQMIADISESPVVQRQLNEVDNDIEAIDHLIDEILTYSRLESSAGQLPLAKEWIECHDLVREIIETLNSCYDQVALTLQGKASLWVLADRRYLKRALMNVVCNACQYAERRVVIHLGIVHGVARIQVDDDGPGIPAHSRQKVLKPFVRLDGSRTRSSDTGPFSSGHGLGLAIVAKIVAWHAGRLSISTAPRLHGTRVSLLIWTPPQDAQGADHKALLPRVSR